MYGVLRVVMCGQYEGGGIAVLESIRVVSTCREIEPDVSKPRGLRPKYQV